MGGFSLVSSDGDGATENNIAMSYPSSSRQTVAEFVSLHAFPIGSPSLDGKLVRLKQTLDTFTRHR